MVKDTAYILGCAVLLLAGICACQKAGEDLTDRTPVTVTVAMDSRPQGSIAKQSGAQGTKAADKTFEGADRLVAHLRHTVSEGGNVTEAHFDRTVTFTVNANPTMTEDGENICFTSDLTPDSPLYWDDFSNAATDIRLSGHGLQSEWGWCYNGNASAPETHSDELDWKVETDQTAGIRTSDLLWSPSQNPVPYEHRNSNNDVSRKGIVIPFTHAMSKTTIRITAGLGFETSAFANTGIVLEDVRTGGHFKASTSTISEPFSAGDIRMSSLGVNKDGEGRNYITFECVFVPGTALADGQLWASISDVEGNDYEISLSTAILEAWGNPGVSEPGVNYSIAATVDKQSLSVTASIQDWENREAEGRAEINFGTDLRNIVTEDGDPLLNGNSYDIFRGTAKENVSLVSVAGYSDGVWTNEPEVYWANAWTNYYFRALATLEESGVTSVSKAVGVNPGDDETPVFEASQGRDLLWATTPRHSGEDNEGNTVTVERGEAISPRTSDVPLRFEHAMSRISVRLVSTTEPGAEIDLDGARMILSNLSSDGKIDIENGNITPGTLRTESYSVTATPGGSVVTELDITSGLCVIPQEIPDDSRMQIILKDGTKYSLRLNQCSDSTSGAAPGTVISEWVRGKSYSYTIHIGKEAIVFRALVKDWTESTGDGNASLDWD